MFLPLKRALYVFTMKLLMRFDVIIIYLKLLNYVNVVYIFFIKLLAMISVSILKLMQMLKVLGLRFVKYEGVFAILFEFFFRYLKH
jgi:hypothetical protein